MKKKNDWPNKAKCAVNLTFDNLGKAFDLFRYGNDQGAFSEGQYSIRRGLYRILQLLEKYDIKATFFIEGWNGENNKEIVKEISNQGHEVAAHGWLHEGGLGVSSPWNKLNPDEEKKLIERSTISLHNATGIRPIGWRSPGALMSTRTIKYLYTMGYIYSSDFVDDDTPYIMEIDGKPVNFAQLPFDWTLDDAMYYSHKSFIRSPNEVLKIWKEEFDVRYAETGYFNLVCHPRFSGRPTKIKALERLILHIKKSKNVWFSRCLDVANWMLKDGL
jgi:peptidoglycan/xylan/chitin deacetylase (PgdA/CDA1 family)